ncbi:MAG: hypothetical protein AAF805_00490 [Planctomycetota bacterium]
MTAPPLQSALAARLAAIGAVLLLGATAAQTGAETVLLRTGGMLSGRVEVLSDRVLVHSEGTTLRLERDAVAHVGDSPLAVYDWRRAQLPGEHATEEDHLRLADWAMRHELWPQAALELLDARRIAPESPRVAMLDRRFAELTEQPPKPLAESQPVAELRRDREPEDPSPLSPELVGRFVREVQPLLLNGCAAVGCHGAGYGESPSVPMPLDRTLLYARRDAGVTVRNLRSVLAAIEPGDATGAALLDAARGPHAGTTPLAGRRRATHLARIEAWVHAAAAEMAPASGTSEAIVDRDQTASPLVGGDSASSADDGPRDEFDPAIFNRRFRREDDDAQATAGAEGAR